MRNGDLALGGASLGQVTGPQKLVQDLRCALLERRGHDDAHPTFGSLIDGGLDLDGKEATSLVANSDLQYVAMRVEAEIRRIVADHQSRQLARAQSDRYTYGQSTLENGELLINLTNVNFVQVQDSLFCNVSLQTQGGVVSISVPLADSPLMTT